MVLIVQLKSAITIKLLMVLESVLTHQNAQFTGRMDYAMTLANTKNMKMELTLVLILQIAQIY